MQSWLEGRNWIGKCCTSTGMTESLRYCQAKQIQTLGKSFTRRWTEVGVSASRVTTLRHIQERATKPLLKQKHHQKHLIWLRRKITGLLLSGPKSSFQMKVIFHFNLEIKVPESWRKSGEAQNQCCLKSSVKFPQSVMIWATMSSAGVGPLCFLKSTVNAAFYQDILEQFMLPSADKLYGDADFISSRSWHRTHCQRYKSWFIWPWC